jgi:hypothetical protein
VRVPAALVPVVDTEMLEPKPRVGRLAVGKVQLPLSSLLYHFLTKCLHAGIGSRGWGI